MSTLSTDAAPPRQVTRFEIWPTDHAADPRAATVLRQARDELPVEVKSARVAQVFLIESSLDDQNAEHIAEELLADPVNQSATIGCMAADSQTQTIEIHYLPGVMDPVAQSTQDAIREMLPGIDDVQVRTGWRYDFDVVEPIDSASLQAFASRHLANSVVQSIHLETDSPTAFAQGTPYTFELRHISILDLDDAGLEKLSREGHLFLSLDEMRAIQDYYCNQGEAGREPTDIELETLAQTWSEHCVHKTLKSTILYRGQQDKKASSNSIFENKPGHKIDADGNVTIHNLLKSTVAAATFELKKRWQGTDREGWLVSVFDDNAGIVKFDETDGVAIKVETHNHPSALEPYGGAATGIGGCIRDIMGTGLFAKPIANTNVFCVAPPEFGTSEQPVPAGVIPARRILEQVVAGVRDYGNRMGIPTVNGSVCFDPDYVANPLVFAGCVGLIPLDKCFGEPQPGDRIIILGGETGRDGIHGATFSSAELTDTHADEFSHAVQIGNAITQKKTLDVIQQARDPRKFGLDVPEGHPNDRPLFNAISDCGAGGFSSAVGEMGEKIGARVTLDTAPLKYDGLSYTEIWISEAQERMPLAVPPENVQLLKRLAEKENVGFCDLGEFGYEENGQPTLLLTYKGEEVGKLGMAFMHDGIPMPTREATWSGEKENDEKRKVSAIRHSAFVDLSFTNALLTLLSHPTIASKHWIVRQYDHEVQAGSVIKPLVGPEQDGPSDAAVIRPKADSPRGVTLAHGLAPQLSEKATQRGLAVNGDSYQATLHAMDEAVRNAVCVGADPKRLAILDNFCWPRCDDPEQLGSLVRAAEACYDGALAYQAPFVSGKDSLSNQFTTEAGELITIAPTLLITAMGLLEDVTTARTMEAKSSGNALFIVGTTGPQLGGSHLAIVGHAPADANLHIPTVDLEAGPRNAEAVAALIAERRVASAHDCSDGGLLVAVAEMAFAGRVGLDLDLSVLPTEGEPTLTARCFAESASRYLLEIEPGQVDAVIRSLKENGIPFAQIGTFTDHDRLTARTADAGRFLDQPLDELREAWLKPLDW